jgi:hypothetical protein
VKFLRGCRGQAALGDVLLDERDDPRLAAHLADRPRIRRAHLNRSANATMQRTLVVRHDVTAA